MDHTHHVKDDVRASMKQLELLDLSKRHTVSDIVEGMARCSFGARMLGEVAHTLVEWINGSSRTIVVYDGPTTGTSYQQLVAMGRRGYVYVICTSEEFAHRTDPSQQYRVLVVGEYSERWSEALAANRETIYINRSGQIPDGCVRDGHFPNAVFADPRFVMTVLEAVLVERLHGGTVSVPDLMEVLPYYGGLAAEVAHGAETLRQAVSDPDTTVCMTLSGAMTIAQMGLLVCDMLDLEMVDYVASTGALMAHGLVQGIGLKHYAYDPKHSDALLAKQKLNRVTDTLEPEENFDHIEDIVAAVLALFSGAHPISPTIFHRAIGKYLHDHFPDQRGILKSAFEHGIPIAVPAFVDSEIGNDVYVENMRRKAEGRQQLVFDMEIDTELLVRMASQAKRLAIFSIGGGVPRNNTQNVAPLIEIINARTGANLSEKGFHYACRIDPTPMHFGNLSGCTYSEGESWRKFTPDGRRSEVHADATIVWPFILKYVLDRFEGRKGRHVLGGKS